MGKEGMRGEERGIEEMVGKERGNMGGEKKRRGLKMRGDGKRWDKREIEGNIGYGREGEGYYRMVVFSNKT